MGRKNSQRSTSEIKTEFEAKEALEDEKVAALESKLQKILNGFPIESSTKSCAETPKCKPREERIPTTPITRQRKLTFDDSSVFIMPQQLSSEGSIIYNSIFSEVNSKLVTIFYYILIFFICFLTC